MGNPKIKKIIISTCLLCSVSATALTYDEFLKQQQNQYKQYKDTIQEEYLEYKKAYDESLKEFRSDLGKTWPEKTPEISTKHKWVEYDKNLNSRKSVDFEKQEINFEVIATSKEEARKKINEMYNDLLLKDVKSAYQDDILETKIAKKLKKPKAKIQSNRKIISDMISTQEKTRIKEKLQKQDLIVVKYKDKFIYKSNIKLPSDSTVKKARAFKKDVVKNANKQDVPASLIFAIMHSESSFNPMARSYVPAYGLMQIVPKTAGIDSYKFLYKKKRLLSSSYLYDSQKNITIGSAYLHILYYKYLRKIKDPQSRFYCTIAAYNTGAGNVAKAFTGSTNINKASIKINNLNSDEVYKTLMRKLPYNETKKYLKKVTDRVSSYDKLLKTTL